ncbi:PREDICTED: uncharacterized protein LOC107355885 [Acropora digitifera]|uniref:uncharacterized protein LOC107355885 n=1 Tax=Acropora digitifera TaxID=70779 RepID=UPI00077A20C9|nr:PREDICTED: uncharacterized protein LOC107355885 [Acropora digitifera]
MMPKIFTFLLLFYMSQITQAKKEPAKKSIRDDLIIRAFIEARPRHKRGAQCKDNISYCDSYRAYCSDPQYKDYLEANCKNTCGFCGGAQCKDTISYCNSYQAYCSHPEYKDYLEVNCKNTCGFCEVGPTPSVSTIPPRTELPIDQGIKIITLTMLSSLSLSRICVGCRLVTRVQHVRQVRVFN